MTRVWLAAEYIFAGLYSCRVLGSGSTMAQALPAPGPATVRLALLRSGIELFGLDFVRSTLFYEIRSAEVAIRPPERVALSVHRKRAYKPSQRRITTVYHQLYEESVVLREYAHALGTLGIYIAVSSTAVDYLSQVLQAIGYWGQKDSLATCLNCMWSNEMRLGTGFAIRHFPGTIGTPKESNHGRENSPQSGQTRIG